MPPDAPAPQSTTNESHQQCYYTRSFSAQASQRNPTNRTPHGRFRESSPRLHTTKVEVMFTTRVAGSQNDVAPTDHGHNHNHTLNNTVPAAAPLPPPPLPGPEVMRAKALLPPATTSVHSRRGGGGPPGPAPAPLLGDFARDVTSTAGLPPGGPLTASLTISCSFSARSYASINGTHTFTHSL